MNKLYFRLLAIFFIYICLVNLCSFAAGFDARQLTNPFFLKYRTEAAAYLLKNIIIDTGINIKLPSEEEINKAVTAAAEKYGVDKDALGSLVVRKNAFSISLNGGMGLTSINPKQFRQSGCSDPFSTEQNINAAAAALKNFNGESAVLRSGK